MWSLFILGVDDVFRYHIKHKGYGIYRPIRNRYFDRLINKIRRCHNSEMIPQKKAVEIIKSKELKKRTWSLWFC